ncbi:MAG: hypothetical protein KatS3mg111_3031 [Pirellulaceae bacterium]|nr:MAG: hypothetical protein KatS3mg111_3031 [Pirellulaceae bacterium]
MRRKFCRMNENGIARQGYRCARTYALPSRHREAATAEQPTRSLRIDAKEQDLPTTATLRCGSAAEENQRTTPQGARRPRSSPRRGMLRLLLLACVGITCFMPALTQVARLGAAEIDLPAIDPNHRVFLRGDRMAKMQRGHYEILAFEGDCVLQQGALRITASDLIVWVDDDLSEGVLSEAAKLLVLARGAVRVEHHGAWLEDTAWKGRLFTLHQVEYAFDQQVTRYDIPYWEWEHVESQAADSVARPAVAAMSAPDGSSVSSSVRGAGAVAGGLPPVGAPPYPGEQAFLAPHSAHPGVPTSNIPPLAGALPWNSPPTGDSPGTPRTAPSPPSVSPTPNGASAPVAALASTTTSASWRTAQVPPRSPSAGPSTMAMIQSIQFLPRGSVPPEINFQYDASRGESIGTIRGGFKLVIQPSSSSTTTPWLDSGQAITLEADNAVAWLRSDSPLRLEEGFQSTPDRPLELYLEGNIVFSQGNRVIYADRMYYNVASAYGMVLSAEVLTPVPQYQGLLRLKADVIQQLDKQHLRAYGAAVTSSRLGVPRYWLQANEVTFEDYRAEDNLTVFSPWQDNRRTQMSASARSNHLYVAGIPIFYWPTIETDFQEPSFYLTSVKVKNDTIFGAQVFAEWDVYQLLGIRGPEGTKLRLSTDYLSDRGAAVGFRSDYNMALPLIGVPAIGFSDGWFIRDQGIDNLGSDRAALTPEERTRGRILSRQRLFFSPDTTVNVETGWISDRNFLEQYFENEWEQEKDLSTAAWLSAYRGHRYFELRGQLRVNEFFTETERVPQLDLYQLGQEVLGGRGTWNSRWSIGYVHQRFATTPLDPVDAGKFALLPWESDSEGIRALTRQEISVPMNLGPTKVVPYISGEAGFWKEDINQQDVARVTGQAGIRSSLPLWRVYPNVENRLFDLRGLAHKLSLETDFFYADSSQDLSRFPLFDPLDDNAQEHFRRRFIFNTFSGSLPPEFDERGYAIRSGLQRWITSGSPEVVEDLMLLKINLNNRLQTKRGLPGRERIVDLVSFNAGMSYFPRAQRDNFGEDVGAFHYDFRYHLGDRVTLLSDGYADVFSQGLKTVSAGFQISRPGRGDAYVGMLSIEGPISANVLNGYANYRMNEKWIFSGGAAFDFGPTGSIGQSLALTRIGESALVRVGMNIDHGRDNVSFNFNIEPRFLPTVRLGSLGGELIPPAGAFGVE